MKFTIPWDGEVFQELYWNYGHKHHNLKIHHLEQHVMPNAVDDLVVNHTLYHNDHNATLPLQHYVPIQKKKS